MEGALERPQLYSANPGDQRKANTSLSDLDAFVILSSPLRLLFAMGVRGLNIS